MSPLIDEILEMLASDIMHHAFLVQCARQNVAEGSGHPKIEDVLKELLTSEQVEIGNAKLATPEYVEFVAWTGTVEDRVNRAMNAVDVASGTAKDFAYWLCLNRNVDRWETDDEQ